MRETFLDTAEQILRFKSHRDLLVRKMVITMIPSIAAYDTSTFTGHFLHKAMGHLLTAVEKPNERTFGWCYKCRILGFITHFVSAFLAIGHTATAVGSDMKPFLDLIMAHIKQGLQGRGSVVFEVFCSAS